VNAPVTAMPTPAPVMLERLDLEEELRRLEDGLVGEYAAVIPEDIVRDAVHDAVTAVGETRVHHFVPVLVERIARHDLTLWLAAATAAAKP
jgi:hypothetical protein